MDRGRIVEHHGGGAAAAPGATGWLCLAAAPTFAVMALWTGLANGQADLSGMAMPHMSSMDGMMLMYCLMSVFHLPPWLKWISVRRSRVGNRFEWL